MRPYRLYKQSGKLPNELIRCTDLQYYTSTCVRMRQAVRKYLSVEDKWLTFANTLSFLDASAGRRPHAQTTLI